MGRLIDADALNIEQLFDTKNKSIPVSQYVNYLKGIEAVEKIIKNAPTVEERKHGHWIEDIQGDIKCSNCDNYLYPIGVRFQPISDICRKFKRDYCPKCGAIMNEVSEDD